MTILKNFKKRPCQYLEEWIANKEISFIFYLDYLVKLNHVHRLLLQFRGGPEKFLRTGELNFLTLRMILLKVQEKLTLRCHTSFFERGGHTG